jgi:DNA-binding CsgD family transcriptional regulator
LGSQLREICASDPTLSLSNTYQIKDGDQNKSVLVVQIPPKLRHYFMHFKVCAIVTECNGMDAWKQQRLREEYLLSDAEVSTVDLLSAGKTPNLIADIMSLKATSIRQRLKVIYEKTNVNSQVELVALYNQL